MNRVVGFIYFSDETELIGDHIYNLNAFTNIQIKKRANSTMYINKDIFIRDTISMIYPTYMTHCLNYNYL